MIINVLQTPQELGYKAAYLIMMELRKAISQRGQARLLLSTGASQFETISELVKMDVDWSKVTMFHLDEYVNLPKTHKASFRKYLKERFVNQVNLKEAVYVDGTGDVEKNIAYLTDRIREAPIDIGVIGIGENGHIAFNDPPADFETDAAYMVVELDERCKKQQVGEGWFDSLEDVPSRAITMCVKQILSSNMIVTCVPHAVKAEAIKNTLNQPVTPNVPATILKTHKNWNLFLDMESASGFLK